MGIDGKEDGKSIDADFIIGPRTLARKVNVRASHDASQGVNRGKPTVILEFIRTRNADIDGVEINVDAVEVLAVDLLEALRDVAPF